MSLSQKQPGPYHHTANNPYHHTANKRPQICLSTLCRELQRLNPPLKKITPASGQDATRAEYRTEISACEVGQLSLVNRARMARNRARIGADLFGFYPR
jgi:hypothetical protein